MIWKMFKKPLYFAHSLRHYGTKTEKRHAIAIAKLTHLRILNPNGRLPDDASWILEAQRLIDKCQMLVFTEYKKHIGKGVYTEIEYALDTQKPVFLFREGALYPITMDNLNFSHLNWVRYATVTI